MKLKKDLNYDKQLNEPKVERREKDQHDHHQLRHHGMENMKDHGAYQDQRKIRENTMDMDQQTIVFHLVLAKEENQMITEIPIETYRGIHRFSMTRKRNELEIIVYFEKHTEISRLESP